MKQYNRDGKEGEVCIKVASARRVELQMSKLHLRGASHSMVDPRLCRLKADPPQLRAGTTREDRKKGNMRSNASLLRQSFDQQHKLHSASLASDSSSVDRAAKSLPTTSRLDEVGDSPRLSQQHALICLWSCNHLFTQRAPQWYS